jgi:hypothetical protein
MTASGSTNCNIVTVPARGPAVDPALARDVTDAIRALIARLQNQTATRVSQAQTMQVSWTGPYADQFFGAELPRMRRSASDLVGELQTWLSRIDAAAH